MAKKKKKVVPKAKTLKPVDKRQIPLNPEISLKMKDTDIKKVLVRAPADLIALIDQHYNMNGYNSRNDFIVFALREQVMRLLSRRK